MVLPENLLPREKRMHEGREFLLYKREVEPGSSLQKERNTITRELLIKRTDKNRYLGQALRKEVQTILRS